MRVLKADYEDDENPAPENQQQSPVKKRPDDLDLSQIPGSPGLNSSQRPEGAESPSKKAPPVPVRNPSTALSSGASSPTRSSLIQPTNTRSIGEIISIELHKGMQSLSVAYSNNLMLLSDWMYSAV